MSEKLREFRDLDQLHGFHKLPLERPKSSTLTSPLASGEFLATIFKTEDHCQTVCGDTGFQSLAAIIVEEVNGAVRSMSRGKYKDRND